MKRIALITALTLLLFSCETTIELKTRQGPPNIAIEALVTDIPNRQYVKVSRSVGFQTNGRTPPVTSAMVYIEDNHGNRFDFKHNTTQIYDTQGIYVPATDFVGVIGKTYTLHVFFEDEHYTAQDTMTPTLTIDNLYFEIDKDEQRDPKVKDEIYNVFINGKEPRSTKDYYLFNYYRNGALSKFFESDVYFVDDIVLSETINGLGSFVRFKLRDEVKVEVMSLSRAGYLYYNDLSSLLNSDGGMFGSTPATPRTNLSNDALGFFQVSAVTSQTIKIGE